MKNPRRTFLVASSLVALAPGVCLAQSDRPIRIIDTFAPGGTTDVIGRLIANQLTSRLGRPVLVDNRPGAAGITGTTLAAQSAPDGQTVLLGYDGTITLNPSLFSKLPYDPMRDFTPVIKIGDIPFILVAHPAFPPNNFRELVQYAKDNPDKKLFFGTAGAGSSTHLAGELLKELSGVPLLHVPYKGGAPALQDVMSGQIPMGFTAVPAAAGLLASGRVKALAVSTARRSKTTPDVPSFHESGVTGYDVATWVGFFVPSKTPAAVVDQLARATKEVLELSEVRSRLAELAVEVTPLGSSEFSAQIRSDLARWGKVVKASNIKVE